MVTIEAPNRALKRVNVQKSGSLHPRGEQIRPDGAMDTAAGLPVAGKFPREHDPI